MSLDLGVTIAAILLLILMSAFFSGSETALTATSRARLNEIERRGSRRAAMALALTNTRERLIGALLLGNNVANVTASALATALLIDIFGDSGAIIASVIMTVLILIFAEVLPKTYAIAYPDRSAIAVAPLVRVLVAVFGPVVMAVEWVVKMTLRLFGVDISIAQNVLSAHDELRGAIDLHLKEGAVVKKDRDMLGGILDLQDLAVSDLMVHRTRMTLIDGSESPAEIVAKVLKSGHTRIPVWKDKPDNIVGVLHAKNLFAALQRHGGEAEKIDIEDVLSPAWFVPDTRSVTDQLNAFLRRKTHFAIVVDEYGELQGLITLEDIIEEIVGDIKDEFDAVATGVRQKPDGSFTVDGGVPVRDLNRAFDWHLPDDEATTLAGLVIHEARMIPDVGQTFNFHGFQFEVLKKRKHQVTSIKVTPLKRAPDEAEDG
ncbi:MAG: HlyC/CorC family transporter [Rhizobiales bacterium]|nr:HlyC/CorC family transporter [Hyphomicrobiales bacterium]MBI3672338.1 HlyC/CorC family transporter [Hyphomicrobiales bacterium]